MASKDDRRYLESHEWHKLDGGLVVIGISHFAVEELTDITFLDIQKQSGPIEAGQRFGEIESVKATSELYCGVAGEVVAFNQAAIDNPEIINQDPWEKGWLIKINPANVNDLQNLLTSEQYDDRVGA